MTAHAHPTKRRPSTSLARLLMLLALVATPCPPVVAQEASGELGRLFFSPERRQHLDRQRQLNIQEKQDIPEDPTLTINGVVTRSDGKRTVWVNGTVQNDNEAPSGVVVRPNRNDAGNVTVQNAGTAEAGAKVGGTVNRNTGESTDILNGGKIRIHAKPTAAR